MNKIPSDQRLDLDPSCISLGYDSLAMSVSNFRGLERAVSSQTCCVTWLLPILMLGEARSSSGIHTSISWRYPWVFVGVVFQGWSAQLKRSGNVDICHIMTVNAFAKDKLGKSPNLNCFSSYLFHGRRILFPFQLFILVIQLSLSVKGRGSIARMLQTKCQWGCSWDAGSELLAPTAQDQEAALVLGWTGALLLSLTWALLPVSSFLTFQGFWSFSISFCWIFFSCTVASGPFWGCLHPC